jgi:hypothetical protein
MRLQDGKKRRSGVEPEDRRPRGRHADCGRLHPKQIMHSLPLRALANAGISGASIFDGRLAAGDDADLGIGKLRALFSASSTKPPCAGKKAVPLRLNVHSARPLSNR